MKNILLAVRPKWCEKICHEIGKDENGKAIYEKRIEVRKTAPKELSEFKTGCKGCKERDTYHCKFYCYGERPITRPPQSYMFVKEL